MKNVIKGFIFISTILMAVGCHVNSSSFVMRVSNSTSTHFSSRHHKFNGSVKYIIDVKEGKHDLVLKVNITTSSGEINYSISPIDGDALYAYSTIEDVEKEYVLPNYGRYKIVLNGNDHEGSYNFSWAKPVN